MTAAPRCTVGLLTWNGEQDVAACVRSLIAQTEPNIEFIWVDNASSDSTCKVVAQACPQFPAPVIMDHNTGFCGGHNHAFGLASGRYYLALNQDAVLAVDYIQRLCDWMDEVPELGLSSGLILWGGDRPAEESKIYSAGMAMGHGRFPFELERNQVLAERHRVKRCVPAVTGAAMMIRRAAAEDSGTESGKLFPREFFAYFEEVDLAMRLAEADWKCGVEGGALAWHAERGQGGSGHTSIRAHYLKNHWLVSLRHDSILDWLREFPAIVLGEIRHYAPKYLTAPGATLRAIVQCAQLIAKSRRARGYMIEKHAAAAVGRRRFYDESRRILAGADSKASEL